ncbi:selenite/tellurite reduction operon rhodanese-like protein ExtH [Halobiforma nitratireducens]|uniref:Rhodanese-like protein n=1 Tax=Halobiforma nitratireducens JCM 10879 TaxID=1227454 RepID=M0M6K1_9EURY|nr:selenite/tellurite reduction operon rhodanese-like protein ExtH [Halobiforma nitratireducens]EMA41003.1 rhodanese-like protein [Halobiforma nitratireducens JCM 10879]
MNSINRRRFLGAAGAVGLSTIAGCTGEEPEETVEEEPEQETDETGETVEEEPEEEPDEEDADPPDPTATDNALIEPATFHEWYEAGLVNNDDPSGSHRVVTLRIDDWYPEDGAIQSFEDGHVPGAVPWEPSAIHAQREEGLGVAAPMVAPGDVIDDVLQKAGVCPRTTLVVSGSSPLRQARGYWTLRYWGFPRERVKVLNGAYTRYGEEYDLETGAFDPAEIPDSTFSVQANGELNNDLRLGIGQMIQRVDNVNDGESDDVILENRSDPKPDVMIQNAIWDDPAGAHEGDHFLDTFEEGAYWKDADAVRSHYDDLGVSADDTILTYCGSGYRATKSFFALDGILEYDDVMMYDGSWGQWVQYAGDDVPEEWRVDMHDRTDGEFDGGGLEITVDETPAVDSADGNQLEATDMEYIAGGDVDIADGGGDGGGDFAC